MGTSLQDVPVPPPLVCVVDLETGFDLFESEKGALVQTGLPFAELIPSGYVEFMRGSTHAEYRHRLGKRIHTGLERSEPHLDRILRSQLESAADESSVDGVEPEPFLDRAVFAILAEVLFGVTSDDRRYGGLRQSYEDLDQHLRLGGKPSVGLRQAYARISSVVTELIGKVDETVTGSLVFMSQIGRENLRGFLLWVVQLLADHPEWGQKVRAAMQGRNGGPAGETALREIETAIVSEVLRLRQSEYAYRVALTDCRVAEYRIPKGWMIGLCLRESHRDADRFPDPDAFRP